MRSSSNQPIWHFRGSIKLGEKPRRSFTLPLTPWMQTESAKLWSLRRPRRVSSVMRACRALLVSQIDWLSVESTVTLGVRFIEVHVTTHGSNRAPSVERWCDWGSIIWLWVCGLMGSIQHSRLISLQWNFAHIANSTNRSKYSSTEAVHPKVDTQSKINER